MIEDEWAPLRRELARWDRAGRRPTFWLRDDDAVEPTPALEQLLALCDRYQVPVVLASIPAHATQALADRLASTPLTTVAVHGWSHQNHAPEGQKKQELGLHRRESEVVTDLQRGLDGIGKLFGKQAIPLLVPPWNRIDPELLPALPTLGFQALSTYGPTKPAPLPLINSTVDIMDWHGTRSCLPTAVLVDMITAQLRSAYDNGEATGLLTHHLVHDEAAWDFLQRLFELTSSTQWLGFDALLARTAKPAL